VSILLLANIKSIAQVDNNPKPLLFIGHPSRITSLDSLIKNATSLALNSNDYQYHLKQNAAMDSLGVTAVNNQFINDSIITSVANHFFNDLAYGNRIPALDYNGVKFKFNVNEVPLMVQKYVELESINELVKYYLKKYKEVSIILDTLKYYQSNNTTQFNKIKILQKAANDFRWLNGIKKSNKSKRYEKIYIKII
jgi:hypothetical protein